MENKRLIIFYLIIFASIILISLLITITKKIKVDIFKPAAVIFLIDSSASNQDKLPEQKKYLKQLCKILDPEDQIKIIKVSQDSYLIYEGSPANIREISKSMDAYTKYDPQDVGTAYGIGLEKAFNYALAMKKIGYVPSVVVIGDLENEGQTGGELNWSLLPNYVAEVKHYAPDFSMMFLFAHPQKLDIVKSELDNVLGERKLIVAPEQSVNRIRNKFLYAIGR